MAVSDILKTAQSEAATVQPAENNSVYSALQQAPQSDQGAVRVTSYIDSAGKKKKGTTTWDKMKQGYQQAYQAQQDQNARALEAAQQRAQEATAAQIEALNQGYQGTNRQLYRDYMERQRTLPQQLAAQGYTGGLTESSRLRLGNAYEEALNSNEQARLGQEAGYNEALNQRLYEAQATADAANSQALQNYYSQILELQAQQQEQERSDLEKRAATMAATGDFSLYKKLGYTNKEIRYLQRMFKKQHPELYRKKQTNSGGGGYSSTTKTKTETGSPEKKTSTKPAQRTDGKKKEKKTSTKPAYEDISDAQADGAWNGFY